MLFHERDDVRARASLSPRRNGIISRRGGRRDGRVENACDRDECHQHDGHADGALVKGRAWALRLPGKRCLDAFAVQGAWGVARHNVE